jgi:hypothetical protein
MPNVQVNKWVRLLLTVITALSVSLAAYPWTDLVDKKTAAVISLAILGLKGVIDAIAPGPGVLTTPVPGATSASLVTHKAVGST